MDKNISFAGNKYLFKKKISLLQTMFPWSKVYISLMFTSVIIVIICIITSIVLSQQTEEKTVGFVTSKSLGLNGRLGNQLFQISSALGLGHSLNKPTILPVWTFSNMFEDSSNILKFDGNVNNENTMTFQEHSCFEFDSNIENFSSHKSAQIDVYGYRQNTQYFNHITHLIRKLFRIKQSFKQSIIDKYPFLTQKVIGVHVRRGDYVNNPVHDICTKEYYLKSIEFFQNNREKRLPVLFVSDDIPWCKETFSNEDFQFSEFTNDIDDFVCLTMCSYKVISNSTFAWWCSFLDARFDSQVIAPEPWINASHQTEGCKNLYQENWHIYHIQNNMIEISKHLPIELGGYYQCFKQPYAFINVLQAYREVYPSSSLIIVSDAGDDFSQAALYFQAKSYTTNKLRGGNGITTNMTDATKLKDFLRNFLIGAQKIEQKYFTLLEDDVMFSHAVYIEETSLEDITGMNEPFVLLHIKLLNHIQEFTNYKGPAYVTGCGGSIFKTSFWNQLVWDTVEKQLDFFVSCNVGFHADIALSFICYMNNGTTVCGKNLLPADMTEIEPKIGAVRSPAILHQYKDFYNQELTKNEHQILLWD